MNIQQSAMSPWGKNSIFDDPFVNLSNKKNHSHFDNSKDLNNDRYIAQSIQKCLFKDKL